MDPRLSSVAIRVHHLDSMVRFYSLAFGVHFHEVETFGIQSRFGDLHGLTLKFVPIRESVDFEGYPLHQLGFTVEDADATIRAAEACGGRLEGEIQRDGSGDSRRGARPRRKHDRTLFPRLISRSQAFGAAEQLDGTILQAPNLAFVGAAPSAGRPAQSESGALAGRPVQSCLPSGWYDGSPSAFPPRALEGPSTFPGGSTS